MKIRDGEPINCFVGIVDILGFKHHFSNEKIHPTLEGRTKVIHDTMVVAYAGIKDFLEEVGNAHGGNVGTKYFRHEGKVATDPDHIYSWDCVSIISKKIRYFSDTVFFYLPSPTNDPKKKREEIRAMCFATSAIIKLPSLYPKFKISQIVLRGGLAYGPIIEDEKTGAFCGQPIIDAYELSEAQDWMGAAVHPTLHKFIDGWSSELVRFNAPLYQYKVPIGNDDATDKNELEELRKKYKDVKYAVNWVQTHDANPNVFKGARNAKQPRPYLDDIWTGNIGHYNWGNEASKCNNTHTFVKTICDEYESSDDY
jgi:hypothetical protein